MLMLSFEAPGQPVPQGSVRGFVAGGRAIITSDNSKLRPWRDTVTWAARDVLRGHSERASFPITGPVQLVLSFWMHRPKNRPKTVDVLPLVPPDLDKLIRAVGDSLVNAGVIRDDSQVVSITTTKRYAVGPDLAKIYVEHFHQHTPCVLVRVEEMRT